MEEHLVERLRNLNFVIHELLERAEDKYDAGRYKSLVQALHNPSILQEIKDIALKYSDTAIAKEVLEIMLTLLRPERQLKQKKEFIKSSIKKDELPE